MTLDEFEALRLADLNGMYQADAANEMGCLEPGSAGSSSRRTGRWPM